MDGHSAVGCGETDGGDGQVGNDRQAKDVGCTYTGDCRDVTRFATRSEVQNLQFRFPQSPNPNFSMGFRSEDLLNQTLNRRSGSGSNPVLTVREPDRGQSSHRCWETAKKMVSTLVSCDGTCDGTNRIQTTVIKPVEHDRCVDEKNDRGRLERPISHKLELRIYLH
jgi:hypothetical protein